uniref:(northern house mosquito) hypothetical protein n=1 Tax=Culex pipiens TaxID=7175 RepID=A0A8D8FAM4_CULPI
MQMTRVIAVPQASRTSEVPASSTSAWRRSTAWPSSRTPAASAVSLWPPTKLVISLEPSTTDPLHPATSAVRARKSAAGRTATSCPICDTPSGASGGHRAVFRASITSSMVTPPAVCTTRPTRTKR